MKKVNFAMFYRVPSLEKLEHKHLLAADIGPISESGELLIQGSDDADRVVVSQGGSGSHREAAWQ